MKIIVFADVHGNLTALNKLRTKRDYKKANQRIFLGDALCLGPNSKECVETIIDDGCTYVEGNYEQVFIEKSTYSPAGSRIDSSQRLAVFVEVGEELRERLSKVVKKEYEILHEGKKILFLHYARRTNGYHKPVSEFGKKISHDFVRDIFKEAEADYVFYGHEHTPMTVKDGNRLLVGVGTCGARVVANYLVLVIKKGRDIKIKRKKFRYPLKNYIKQVKEKHYSGWEETILQLKNEKKVLKGQTEK